MNKIFFIMVLIAMIFYGFKPEKNISSGPIIEIPDSLMHFIKIDSSNIESLRLNIGKNWHYSECSLNKDQLLKIERHIYEYAVKDSLIPNSHFINKFNELRRQYINLNDSLTQYLYVRYTYFANDKWNTRFWQMNKWTFNKYIYSWMNADVYQFDCLISLINNNSLSFRTYLPR